MQPTRKIDEPGSVDALRIWLHALPADYPLGLQRQGQSSQRISVTGHYCLAKGIAVPQWPDGTPVWVRAYDALVDAVRAGSGPPVPISPTVAWGILETLLLIGNLYGFAVQQEEEPRDALQASCAHEDIQITLLEENYAGKYGFQHGRIRYVEGNDERSLVGRFDAKCPVCPLDATYESVEDAPESVRVRHQQAMDRFERGR